MKKSLLIFVSLIISINTYSRDLKIFDFNEFEPYLNKNNDTTYVITSGLPGAYLALKNCRYLKKLMKSTTKKKLKLYSLALILKHKLKLN